ncbi:hypothetical protein F5141DRAFT_812343 [Pisolithus sp. B1]|nr:hypothetical protein F5141DRAFT_812343 [Pisolithus sp. B1]
MRGVPLSVRVVVWEVAAVQEVPALACLDGTAVAADCLSGVTREYSSFQPRIKSRRSLCEFRQSAFGAAPLPAGTAPPSNLFQVHSPFPASWR